MEHTYASIVPLIGGETIAMQNVFQKKPEYILSYAAFTPNDNHLVEYYKNEVPYHVLDDGGNHNVRSVDVVNTVCPCAGLSSLNTSASSDASANDWMSTSAIMSWVHSNLEYSGAKTHLDLLQKWESLLLKVSVKLEESMATLSRYIKQSLSFMDSDK